MNIDEFRNALRLLFHDAINAGLDLDHLLEAAQNELARRRADARRGRMDTPIEESAP
jgi:hypothetical protein